MATFDSIVMAPLREQYVKTGVNVSNPTGPLPLDTIDPNASKYIVFDQLGTLPINSSINNMVSNKGSHFVTNPIVNTILFPMPFNENAEFMMKEQQRYRIIIYSKESTDDRRDIIFDRNSIMRRFQKPAFSIESWNFIQAVSEQFPASVYDVKDAKEILHQWSLMGPVVSEEGAENFFRNQNTTKKPQRIYNGTQWGYTETHNIWGTNLKPGTPLYFIFKKVKHAKSYYVNPFSQQPVQTKEFIVETGRNLAELEEGEESDNTNTVTPIPFQFVPWADPLKGTPTKEDLKYTDEFGFVRYGEAIRVGYYHNAGGSEDQSKYLGKDSHSSVAGYATMNLQTIWILWECSL